LQQVLQLAGLMHGQLHMNARMVAPERREGRREQGAVAQARAADGERAALQAAQFVEFGGQLLARGQQLQRPFMDDPAGGGQLAAVPPALQELEAHLVLELPHGLAHCRLGREHHACRLREAALPDHLDEKSEAAEIKVHSHVECIP
jgi:hypothetical protein